MKFGGTFIAATVVAALAAGCSGDPAPKEPTSRPGPTVTATPPEMPEQAREDSPEGAAAFVAYWVDVSNYAAVTGDVEELSRLSDTKCAGCNKYIELYRSTYANGGFFRGGDWSLGELRLEQGPAQYFATTTVRYTASRFKEAAGLPVERAASSSDKVSFAVSRDGRFRQVTQVGLGDVR